VEDIYNIQIEGIKNSEGKEFKILDTGGDENCQNMLDQWINTASGFILVFSINDIETFEDLKNKIKRIEKNEVNNLPKVIVGNKLDLNEERKITYQHAEEFAKSIGASYFETSAFTDSNGNVKKIFEECANRILGNVGENNNEEKKCICCLTF
jgi:small GTP-binding protein